MSVRRRSPRGLISAGPLYRPVSVRVHRASGLTGTAVCYATRVELLRQGPFAHLGDRAPERRVIPFADLRGVAFAPAGAVSTGYVEFVSRGEPVTADGRTEMVARARADDAVLFTRTQQDAFVDLRDAVRERLLAWADDRPETESREQVLAGDITEEQYRNRLADLVRREP